MNKKKNTHKKEDKKKEVKKNSNKKVIKKEAMNKKSKKREVNNRKKKRITKKDVKKILKNKICCIKCKKQIDIKKDKYVTIITTNKNIEIENVKFHMKCWNDYMNDILEIQMAQKTQKVLMNVDKFLNNVLN